MIWKNSFIVFGLLPVCLCLTIPNAGPGSYENLLIAINEKYVLPDVASEMAFLNNIKTFISQASRRLYDSTKNIFYFKSVKILLPSTWQGTTADYPYDRAIDESFAEADVRIFPFDNGYIAPFTQRSKYCGAQGEYIYLSPDYINKMGEQANPSKAFVQEWGIYRWGLFEEYGIQRDGTQTLSRFPYIETPTDNIDDWKATGCSNVKIDGEYGYYDYDFDGSLLFEEYCDTGLVEIGYCRFVANPGQTATTSMLYLSHLDSVTDFCDVGVHDKTSKNRHNYFCNERSAWEVIRNHPDYTGRTEGTEYPGDPTFTYVKPKFGAPAIYILIDTSNGATGTEVFSALKTRLSSWISDEMRDSGSLIGLGEFGGTEASSNNGLPYGYIVNKISPGPVSLNAGELSSAINGLTQTRPPGILIDKAIGDAAVLLTNRFRQQGSIVLLFKLTSGDSVSAALPEGPIIDLLTSRKSRLYSLEYSVSNVDQASLKRVAESSLGMPYAGGTNLNSFNEALNAILTDVKAIAVNGFPNVNRIVEVGLNNFNIPASGSYDSTFQMYINPSPAIDFQFYVNAGASVTVTISGNVTRVLQKETGTSWNLNQWDLYSVSFTDPSQTSRYTWCYRVENTGPEPVTVYALAHGLRTKDPPGLGDPTDPKGDIHEFELWVTEVNGEITVSNSPNRPFGIYAYFFNGLRAIKALEVYATVTAPNGYSTRIRLYDDQPKNGTKNYDVDLEDNDGVYSNVFAPSMQGVHHISVEARSPRAPNCKLSKQETDVFVELESPREESRLIPRALLPDQNDLYPPFGSIGAGQAYFQRYFPYFKSVNIKYTSYMNLPPRLLSFRVTPAASEAQATISFYEPHLYDGARTPDGYTIRYSTNRSALIRSDGLLNVGTASLEALPDHILSGDLNHVGSAASKEVTFTVYGYSNEVQTVYFVMATKLNGPPVRYGPPSPIFSADVKTIEIVTTTTSTTTTTTTTTPSTTTAETTTRTTQTVTSTETTITATTTLRPIPTVTIIQPTEEPMPCCADKILSFSVLLTVLLSAFAL